MKLWLRVIWQLASWRFRPRLAINQVATRSFRVWPSDLDIYRHMNNGIYLTIMDIGRYDQGLRTGLWQQWRKRGWYPVVVNATITFRKSLEPFQKFEVETMVIGWDDISYFLEQRFVRNGEIYARAIMRGRFLKRPWGTLTPAEVMNVGAGWPGAEPKLPEWVKRWAQDGALPKGKEPAPSEWPDN
jgi:acyl-CoA thioesterase FadM